MIDTTTRTCPDCGEKLAIHENSTFVRCPQCGVWRFIPTGQPGELRFGDGGVPTISIHRLTNEVKILENQLLALVGRWGLIDLIRNIGFILVGTGIVYALLSSMTNLALLDYGVYAILAGILLHGASQLFGREYFIQKAFLEELILIRLNEIEQHRSGLLKSGKISL